MFRKSLLIAIVASFLICSQTWGKADLTVWIMVTEEERESFRIAMNELRDSFLEDIGQEVSIEIVLISWATARDRIAEALADHEKAPDICQVGSTWIAWVISDTTKIVPLELRDFRQFVQAALPDEFRVPGSDYFFYAIPWFMDVRAMCYNKKLYSDAPIETSNEQWNWKVLQDACAEMKEKSANSKMQEELTHPKEEFLPIAFSGMREWTLLHDTAPWIWGAFDENIPGNTVTDSVKEAINFTVLLARVYGNIEDLHLNREQVEDMFLRGQYAMIVSGYWLIGRSNDYKSLAGNISPEDIGILPIPAPEGKKSYTFIGGSHLVLFSKPSEQRSEYETQLARDFIKFLLSSEQQVSYSEKARVLPARVAALDEIGKLFPHAMEFKKLLSSGRSYPPREDWANTEFRLVKNLTLVWDYASGLYTDIQDMETSEEGRHTMSPIVGQTLSQIIDIEPRWKYILPSNKES